jgi:biopolymer transport protein ExbB
MTIISSLVSLGTLVGLLGTVELKRFALAAAGTPDQAQLLQISEAY